ncbi:unnamed protein product [Protopolystoma xenopodis]|uniref:BRCT domain-containing protein n=1 Tax=Protopolystoma xenopodis TaxID=117903 RepID=A0A3S5CGJ8_9PLAT|nr:unnamed protein product [Protopolystoma xenopodis]
MVGMFCQSETIWSNDDEEEVAQTAFSHSQIWREAKISLVSSTRQSSLDYKVRQVPPSWLLRCLHRDYFIELENLFVLGVLLGPIFILAPKL